MPHLRVHQTVGELAANQSAAADPGANRNVDRGFQAQGGAPPRFTQGGAVHIRVEPYRHTKRLLEWTDDVGIRPPDLRRRGHVAVARAAAAELDRPEATNTERFDLRLGLKQLDALAERLFRSRGWKPSLCSQILGASADGAQKLGPTSFDRSVQRHLGAHHATAARTARTARTVRT